MKNKILTGCASLLWMLYACQSGSRGDKAQDHTLDTTAQQLSTVANEPLRFHLVKVAGERDTISFEIEQPSLVTATLSTPSDTGNIRINQIIMPDGTMDGPFGKTYKDSLYIPGTYQLIIAESLMQGDTYGGGYDVEIEIRK